MKNERNILAKTLTRIARMLKSIYAFDFNSIMADKALTFFDNFMGYVNDIKPSPKPKGIFSLFTMDDSGMVIDEAKNNIQKSAGSCKDALKKGVDSKTADGFKNAIYEKSRDFIKLIDAAAELGDAVQGKMSDNPYENIVPNGIIGSMNHFLSSLSNAMGFSTVKELRQELGTRHFNQQHPNIMRSGRRMRSRRKLAAIGII